MRDLSAAERLALRAYLQHAVLAVHPRYLGPVLALADGRLQAAEAAVRPQRASVDSGAGVAVIQIFGAITHRANCLSEWLGFACVEDIRAQLRAALNDPAVGSIAFVIDSPGGEVSGIADLAAEIRAARGKKPMTTIADEDCYSAAYWLGCSADRVVLTTTAGVGSIGCIAAHVDESGMYEKAGAKVTVVKSGRKKAQYNSLEPLTDEAKADLQAEVDHVRDLFAKHVAACRDGLEFDAIVAFEGGTFSGKDAVKAGLADEVTTVDAALQALQRAVNRNQRGAAATATERSSSMKDQVRTDGTAGDGGAEAGASTAADAKRDELAERRGAAAEQARTRAIRASFGFAMRKATKDERRQLEAKLNAFLDDPKVTAEAASDALVELLATFQSQDEVDNTQKPGASTTATYKGKPCATSFPDPADVFARRREAMGSHR